MIEAPEPVDDDEPLTRNRWFVTIGDRVFGEVVPRLADELLAEREAPRHGITRDRSAPLHWATYVVWAALTRERLFNEPFEAFLGDPDLDILPLKPVVVDPTQLPARNVSSGS